MPEYRLGSPSHLGPKVRRGPYRIGERVGYDLRGNSLNQPDAPIDPTVDFY